MSCARSKRSRHCKAYKLYVNRGKIRETPGRPFRLPGVLHFIIYAAAPFPPGAERAVFCAHAPGRGRTAAAEAPSPAAPEGPTSETAAKSPVSSASKAVLEQPCGIAAHDGVRFYVPRHNGISRNNGAVTDFYARHNGAFPPQPYIAAHNGIAFEWELGQVRRRLFSPCAAEYIEWVSGDAAHPVVRAAHNEARAARNAAELPDDESVAEFGPVEQHVVLFKIRRCSGSS